MLLCLFVTVLCRRLRQRQFPLFTERAARVRPAESQRPFGAWRIVPAWEDDHVRGPLSGREVAEIAIVEAVARLLAQIAVDRAREAAVQMLYQWEVGRVSMFEVRQTFWGGPASEEALSEEERAIRDTVRAWVDENLIPVIGQAYIDGKFPKQLIPGMAELGLFAL